MSRPFTLIQLRYFCAVARAGSMTTAAHDLTVAQSTLSSTIHELEHALETALFERTPRRTLELSASGRRLLAETLPILDEIDGLPALARGDGDELAGELVVGMFSPLASFRAPRLLGMLKARWPRLNVRFIEAHQEELRVALSARRCDVALMYGIGLDSGFQVADLEVLQPHILVAVDNEMATRSASVTLADLVDEPFVLLDLPHTRDYYLGLFAAQGLRPNIVHRLPGYEAVRAFVACGHGYSLVALPVRRPCRSSRYAIG
ncbi:Transcriptional regulator, LysR family (fragment) [Nostocoides japonicum T1-X7]|uniref:Transcriptional regulator, LysR family n=1 Tax=Nostocoides japonicum T1-X7 TaxID=1194083 RepID=A0A077LZF8_9MICO